MGEERPLELNGKKYISAKRAASSFGYSSDYIGQLSRSGKIEAIRVGRDRFIEVESLSLYVESLSRDIETVKSDAEIFKSAAVTTQKPAKFTNIYLVGALGIILALVIILPSFVNTNSRQFDRRLAEASVLGSMVENVDSAYMGFLHKIDVIIVSTWNTLRSKTLALLEPLIGDKTKSTVVVQNTKSTNTTATPELNIEQLRSIVSEQIDQELAKTIDYAQEAQRKSSGMIVTPSTGSLAGDTALINSISNKFSDKVNITVDASGKSGLIKPVFKNSDDGTYLYVLVPSIK